MTHAVYQFQHHRNSRRSLGWVRLEVQNPSEGSIQSRHSDSLISSLAYLPNNFQLIHGILLQAVYPSVEAVRHAEQAELWSKV